MNRRILGNIERLNYIIGGVLIAVSAVFGTRDQAFGIVVGTIISAVNFSILKR